MHKLQLVPSEACYTLVIDCQVTIQEIVLQSNVFIDIISLHKISVMKERPTGCAYLGLMRMET